MDQQDTQRHEAQPQDAPERDVQEQTKWPPDVKDIKHSLICVQDKIQTLKATVQEKEDIILYLTAKLNLEIKLRCDSETNAKVLSSEREYLRNKVQNLSNSLEAQTKLGRDSDKAWQLRFAALEESNKKEKASEASSKALISERQDMENKIQSLSEALEAQTKPGRDSDSDTTRQLRFPALKEESDNKEKAPEASSKAFVSERQEMENKIQSLSKDLEAQTKLVRDKDKAWEDKVAALKLEHDLKEKTIRAAVLPERDALAKELKARTLKMERLQVKCEYHEVEKLSHEAELRRLRRQIVNLEDISLRQKKKNLGFFGRRMEARELELERMKRKVPAREPETPHGSEHRLSPAHTSPPAHSPSPAQRTPPAHSTPSAHSTPPAQRTPPAHSTPSAHSTPPAQRTPPVYSTPSAHSTPPAQRTPPDHSPPPAHSPPPVPPTSSSTPKVSMGVSARGWRRQQS